MSDPGVRDRAQVEQEAEALLAVLDEIVSPCDIGVEPLRPETWAALWWRDFVLRKALPDRDFAIVHDEAKALAALPRLVRELVALLSSRREAQIQHPTPAAQADHARDKD